MEDIGANLKQARQRRDQLSAEIDELEREKAAINDAMERVYAALEQKNMSLERMVHDRSVFDQAIGQMEASFHQVLEQVQSQLGEFQHLHLGAGQESYGWQQQQQQYGPDGNVAPGVALSGGGGVPDPAAASGAHAYASGGYGGAGLVNGGAHNYDGGDSGRGGSAKRRWPSGRRSRTRASSGQSNDSSPGHGAYALG